MYILGIDPGSSSLGLSIIEVNDEMEIVAANAITLTTRDCFNQSTMTLTQSLTEMNSQERVALLIEYMRRWINGMPIDAIAIETSYFNSLSPNSYQSLLYTRTEISKELGRLYPRIPIAEYAPSQIKNAIGIKKAIEFRDKSFVAEKLETLGYFGLVPNLNAVGEDGVDALAIAHTYLSTLQHSYKHDRDYILYYQ